MSSEGEGTNNKLSSLLACQNSENLLTILTASSYVMIATAFITFFATLKIRAPYGRYSEPKGWGPLVHPTLAWVVMESPNIWLVFVMFRLCSKIDATDSHHAGEIHKLTTTKT